MDKNEVRDMVFQMFRKEERIWELMASDGNQTAKEHLERVREAHRIFENGFCGNQCNLCRNDAPSSEDEKPCCMCQTEGRNE